MPAANLYERLLTKTRGRIIRLDKGNLIKEDLDAVPDHAKPTPGQQRLFNTRVTESAEQIRLSEDDTRPLYIEYLFEN